MKRRHTHNSADIRDPKTHITFQENQNETTVITNHNNGPVAIAFNSKEGIGFANGDITSGGQFGAETFSLAGDFLTGIEGFAKHTGTNGVAFDSKGQLFVEGTASALESR
jgi:hypothetical protein